MKLNPPLLCRILGHRYIHETVYGAESLGYFVVICSRRHCGHVYRVYRQLVVLQ